MIPMRRKVKRKFAPASADKAHWHRSVSRAQVSVLYGMARAARLPSAKHSDHDYQQQSRIINYQLAHHESFP
jgi:hypothetical protein